VRTTVGQILINETLPEDMRDYDRVLDKKGMKKLFQELAAQHPEKYREVSHAISQVGWRAAQQTGGFSFGLKHMRKSKAGKAVRKRILKAMETALSDDNLTDEQREALITKYAGREMEKQREAIYEEALAAENPLALQVLSGSRGSPMNLASLLGSDLLYTDQRDRLIPVPVLRSYAEGLTPAEYWAGTYGARRGVMATKFATRDAGFLAKQLNQVAHRLMVVDQDRDGEPDTVRGVPFDVDDPDSEGALLAHPIGGYARNTPVTPKILHNLKRKGIKRVLLRSPMVGGSPEGGIYARDVGIREKSGLPGKGENVGLAAAQALSEPLSQAQLSAKHSGGVAGEEKAVSGFDYINQLIQVPKTFKGGASHSQIDGIVTRIEDAPAGGKYVYVGSDKHFVAEGFGMKVKRGQRVEAGDVLSEGIPNPSEVVKHKGVGEGRRYFTQAFRQVMNEANLTVNRRNVELLSRGLINHVRLTDEYDRYVPDDVVPYSTLERRWKPRAGAVQRKPKEAIGKYLERPYLHYTIGTKVRPSMLKDFDEFGVKDVDVHDDPPPFQPEMIRGMYSVQHDPDWMTRMYGSGIKGSLLRGAQRGASSTELGTSFVPGLARGVEFGRQGLVRQPEPTVKAAASGGFGGWGSTIGAPGGAPQLPNPAGGFKTYTPPKPPAAAKKPLGPFQGTHGDWQKYLKTVKPGVPVHPPPVSSRAHTALPLSSIPKDPAAPYRPWERVQPRYEQGLDPQGRFEMGAGEGGRRPLHEAFRPGMGPYGQYAALEKTRMFSDPLATGPNPYSFAGKPFDYKSLAWRMPAAAVMPGTAGWADPSLKGTSHGNMATLAGLTGLGGIAGAIRPATQWAGRGLQGMQVARSGGLLSKVLPGLAAWKPFAGTTYAGAAGPGYGTVTRVLADGTKVLEPASKAGRLSRFGHFLARAPAAVGSWLAGSTGAIDEGQQAARVAKTTADLAKATTLGQRLMNPIGRAVDALRGTTAATWAARGGGLLARTGAGMARAAPGINAAMLALDAGKEMYQGYHKGRSMGYGARPGAGAWDTYVGTAQAIGHGFHENSREFAQQQLDDREDWEKRWDNLGRPIQSIYTAAGEGFGTAGEYARLAGNKLQERRMAREMQPGLERSAKRMGEMDPALKGWKKVWMGDRMGLQNAQGQRFSFDDAPGDIKQRWFANLRRIEAQNRTKHFMARAQQRRKEQPARIAETHGEFEPTTGMVKTQADKLASGTSTTGAVPGSPRASSYEANVEGEGKGQTDTDTAAPKADLPTPPKPDATATTKAAPKAKAPPPPPSYFGGYRPGFSLAKNPLFQPAAQFAGKMFGQMGSAAALLAGLDVNALGVLTGGKSGKPYSGIGNLFRGVMPGTSRAPAAAPAALPAAAAAAATKTAPAATPPAPTASAAPVQTAAANTLLPDVQQAIAESQGQTSPFAIATDTAATPDIVFPDSPAIEMRTEYSRPLPKPTHGIGGVNVTEPPKPTHGIGGTNVYVPDASKSVRYQLSNDPEFSAQIQALTDNPAMKKHMYGELTRLGDQVRAGMTTMDQAKVQVRDMLSALQSMR
jgi:hypothetical protein